LVIVLVLVRDAFDVTRNRASALSLRRQIAMTI
jgi:hypothetical protein